MARSLLPFFALALLGAGVCAADDPRVKVTIQAEDAAYSADRMKVVEHAAFTGSKGIILADNVDSHLVNPDRDAPGERLFLQLQQVLPTLVHHQLPPTCKDFSEYYLLKLG